MSYLRNNNNNYGKTIVVCHINPQAQSFTKTVHKLYDCVRRDFFVYNYVHQHYYGLQGCISRYNYVVTKIIIIPVLALGMT